MLRAGLRWLTLFLGLSLVVACSSSPTIAPQPTATGEQAAVQLPEEPYRLGPGDQVRIVVFRHPDLSGEFELDGRGAFSMPLIGEVRANGLTARELEEKIATMYADGYLVNPVVSVEVLTYRPFYILGEVNRPGQYEYESGMTVLNAVAKAGGFTYRAKQDGIMLQRGGANAPPVVVSGNTRIQPGDIITVPERFF